jgi:hypothetical protein
MTLQAIRNWVEEINKRSPDVDIDSSCGTQSNVASLRAPRWEQVRHLLRARLRLAADAFADGAIAPFGPRTTVFAALTVLHKETKGI